MKLDHWPPTNGISDSTGRDRDAFAERAWGVYPSNSRFGEFSIESSMVGIHRALTRLFRLLAESRADEDDVSSVILAVGEALANAVEHGNGYADDKRVHVAYSVNNREVCLSVEDDGPGFCVSCATDPTRPENVFRSGGRGILLMKSHASSVKYNPKGNRVTIRKRWHTAPGNIEAQVETQDAPARHKATAPVRPAPRKSTDFPAPEQAARLAGEVRHSFLGTCMRASAGAMMLAGGLALIATLWLMPFGLLMAFTGTALMGSSG